MAASTLHTIDTGHADMIHDAQLDYYSRRLATCSSDKTIRIYNLVGAEHEFQAELVGHEGPVWQVAWAHPKFGSVLASCGYDRKAIVWREASPGSWVPEHTVTASASINSIAWAPHESGLMLACVSSDGQMIVTSKTGDAAWSEPARMADGKQGALAVTWAPHTHLGASLAGRTSVRLATAGCDERVRVWVRTDGGEWREDEEGLLEGPHKRWVRDAAWAPATGLPVNQLASCSEDGKVVVWEQKRAGGRWEPTVVRDFGAPVWRVSWSLTGGILAASSGDPTGEATVTLFKQTLLGDWAEIKAADATVAAAEPAASASASGAGATAAL